MARVSKNGKGKTLYIDISVYPGGGDATKSLTISCPASDTKFKTSLSDEGSKKFKKQVLYFYKQHVLDRK